MLTLGTTTTTASPCSTCLINGVSCNSYNAYGSGSYYFTLLSYNAYGSGSYYFTGYTYFPGSGYVCGSIVTASYTGPCYLYYDGNGYDSIGDVLPYLASSGYIFSSSSTYTFYGYDALAPCSGASGYYCCCVPSSG